MLMNSTPTSPCRLLRNTWYPQIFLVSVQRGERVMVKDKELQRTTTACDSLLLIVCINWNRFIEGDGSQLIHAKQKCKHAFVVYRPSLSQSP